MADAFLFYLPVYHQGFANLLARYPQIKKIYLLSAADLRPFGPTHKDLHALPLATQLKILVALGYDAQVAIDHHQVKISIDDQLIVPRDAAVEQWCKQYLSVNQKLIKKDVFLRWDNKNSLDKKPIKSKKTIAVSELTTLMAVANEESQKSSDWWRHVGCVLKLTSGEFITTHNQHLPNSHSPYINGDVRAQFHKGEHFELTTAIHAEAAAIAEAARRGLVTAGAQIFVTDFPCPVCARLIAATGIKTVYYQRGYSLLDGETILNAFAIKIVQVKS